MQLNINPDDCIDCGSCASLCAQNAIYPEADLPADKAHFAEKNRAYFQ
jgi:NAD-dependent dihydropyrimidine dehydrogenase PreA subunit